MKRILLLLAIIISIVNCAFAQDRLVGGDLSMVPIYEQAGDQWLDENGTAITDLVQYVKEKGWNAVRVRLFVDPTQDTDPATCQDYAYALALAKRVKEADMTLLLDLHYSDTWADPGIQKIPASWTDRSNEALCTQIYEYTKTVVSGFVDDYAAPDYVQIGNEITYGLLWNTEDGKFPANTSEYAAAGYCPTWASQYNAGKTQWERTAALLSKASQAVREANPDTKVVVHTEMGGQPTTGDNFYKHLQTAGFTDYDVIGLSYYPFWNGKIDNLEVLLTKLKSSFPDKTVQVVETAWYNSNYPYSADASNEYTIASLNPKWTADAEGMVQYLNDLTTRLKLYDNVDGLYYWNPEECGKGYNETVWTHNFNRGMWKSSQQQQHTMLITSDGNNPVEALAQYLEDDVVEPREDAGEYFQNLSFETGDLTGWTIVQTFSTQKADGDASWMSTDVVRGTHALELWNQTAEEGPVISQVASVPDGRYTITLKARTNKKGFYLYAGDAKTAIAAETPATWAATTNVTDGTLEIGIGTKAWTDNYGYFDSFTITRIGDANGEEDIDNTNEEEKPKADEFTDEQEILYKLDLKAMTAAVADGTKASGEIVIPDTVKVDEKKYSVNRIAKSAFIANDKLTGVTIGKNVEKIEGSAFSDCWSMSKLNFEGESQLKEIAAWSFNNSAIDSLDIPAGVTVIPEGAFAKCWALDFIALRGEVTSIGAFAFSDWSADEAETAEPSWMPLKKGLWIYSKEAPNIHKKAFCPTDIAEDTLYVHYSLVEDTMYTRIGFKAVVPLDESDGNAEYTDTLGLRYTISPEGLATVVGFNHAHAPQNLDKWELVIPESITMTIDEQKRTIPVTAIGDRAFYNHWKLTSVTLPANLQTIGVWAFYNTAIQSIVLPDFVSEIPEGAFAECWDLKNVEAVGMIQKIGDFAFSAWAETGCASKGGPLERMVLPYTVPEISAKAFFAGDIAEAALYVDADKTTNAAFTALGFKQVLPIDPNAIEEVRNSENEKMRNGVYDITGRRISVPSVSSVHSVLPKGLYIINGRRVLVK